MGTLIGGDAAHLADRVIVTGCQMEFHLDERAGPWCMIELKLFNGSIFKVTVGEEIVGHLQLDGKQIKDVPEVRGYSAPAVMQHGGATKLRLRQWMLPDLAALVKELRAHHRARFETTELKISVRAEHEENLNHASAWLELPNPLPP